MARYILMVVTSPVEGKGEEYNRWYNEQHLRDVLSCDGFERAERFELTVPVMGQFPGKYVALYEMESDDPMRDFGKLGAKMQSGELSQTDSMSAESGIALLTPIKTLAKGE
ncbi:DUF4286 family protein [Sphingomonas crocodyli]|uniref:DUF4286 family protein n=1 Tax=Sphingomonas crocodyli TaxID=1979270 RepID=A0A437M9D6_9SPHN|nr:DUF4286 family protein [Sphingomonas crocodyli]RVT94216.1 hypothetical protein EOD43_10285 [Sphingomonas crocodyli]